MRLVPTAVASVLLSVLLAVAVNVATGGTLPGPLSGVAGLAWPAVAVLAVVTGWLAIRQQRSGPAPSPVPAELPAAPAAFAGRAADLAAVRDLAAGGPVVALVGPPGVGKTALALRFAHDRRSHYPDGQLFALLRGADPDPVAPGAVLARFLRVLGVPDDDRGGSVDDLAARLRSALDGRRVLVLLDDARDAGQVRPLLPGGSGCLVVVTSRRQLPGLPQHDVGALTDEESRALLSAAAPQHLTADPRGTADLLRYCAGFPLALGIAAARLRSRPAWSVAELARRLADEHRRLDELHLGDLTVRSAFASAYADLPVPDRRVFRRAGSHPGRQFGTADAAALADVSEAEAAAALERLVDAHLVESPAAGRYRLHDLLRLFATERVAAEETAAERKVGLVRLLDRITAQAITHSSAVSSASDWLSRERDNILAAVHQGVAAGSYEAVWTVVATVGPLFRSAGDQPDLLALWTDALAAATALGDDHRRVRALRPVSHGQLTGGDTAAALATAEQAVTVARRLGDPAALAHALFGRGRALRHRFRYAEAESDLTGALDRFTALGDTEQQIEVLDTLGTMYQVAGRYAEAVPVLERALAMLPEQTEHAWTMQALSAAYQRTGRTAEATGLNRQVLDLTRRTGDDLAHAYALQQRGWLATDASRHSDASADMRASLAVFERIRNPGGVASAHEAIGIVAVSFGRFADALTAFDTSAALFERLASPIEVGRSRLYRAHALAELGRLGEARRQAADAERLIGDAAVPDLGWVRERLTTLTAG
ncbi:ATP-binding protein [Paractinoplanes rishiriensis]|uniref:ATP-binding protein n=1 Tax=Paractinoplanes rishiriensis TaxID=1050105 RepID=UPI001941AA54|nr:tetratricopeptide repeat protein [Actinoplanes rishiriensis]